MTVAQKNVTNKENILDAARKLADYNMEESPDLAGIYQFPAGDIIRLVLLDPVTIPSDEMVPYYFNAFPQGGVAYPSAIVVIRPEEKDTLPPPPGWGTWGSAVRLWLQEQAHGGVRGVDKMTVVQESIVNIESIGEAAQRLADGNIQNSPDLEAIYWFPAGHIIRLVMLDPVALPSE